MAPGAVCIPLLHQAALPERSFTADRAEVRAERAVTWPADPCPRVLRGHSPCSAGRASKTAGTSGTSAAGRSPRHSGSCQGLWTHTGLWVGPRGPGEGCHARWPSRCGSTSSRALSSHFRAKSPHRSVCPRPNIPLQGRQGSRSCIPGSPGESGLVSRGITQGAQAGAAWVGVGGEGVLEGTSS